jgi:hypothetical protein
MTAAAQRRGSLRPPPNSFFLSTFARFINKKLKNYEHTIPQKRHRNLAQ